MSGTSREASNVGLDSENSLEGSDKSTIPGIESGQGIVDEDDSPLLTDAIAENLLGVTDSTLAQHGSAAKREINTWLKTFDQERRFGHNFDRGDDSEPGAGAFDSFRRNEKQRAMNMSRKTIIRPIPDPRGKLQLSTIQTNSGITGDYHDTQMNPVSDSSVLHSQLSFDSNDDDKFSDTTALSPDEKELFTNHWSDGVLDGTGEVSKPNSVPDAENLPLDTAMLATYERPLDSIGDKTDEIPEIDRGLLRTHMKVRRMRLLTSSFETIRDMLESGSEQQSRECFLNPTYRLVFAKDDGTCHDVVPAIELGDLKNIVESLLSSNIDELEHRGPQDQNVGLTNKSQFKSLTPLGISENKEIFHWVLCRQMGFLRIESFEMLQTLHLAGWGWDVDFTTVDLRQLRRRAPYNIKGRWYDILVRRVAFNEVFKKAKKDSTCFSGTKTISGPSPGDSSASLVTQYVEGWATIDMAIYIGATSPREGLRLTLCLIDVEHERRFGTSVLSILGRLHHDLNRLKFRLAHVQIMKILEADCKKLEPLGWLTCRDSSGRLCWVQEVLFCFTYKTPEAHKTREYMMQKRIARLEKAHKSTRNQENLIS